jgi:hypothetical protein
VITAAEVTAGEPLSVQRYLLAMLEDTVRARLTHFVGPDEVVALAGEWSAIDIAAVESVLGADRLRLTWIVQAALEDGVNIADWRRLLSAVAAAGGIAAPLPGIRDAVQHTVRVSERDGPIIEVPDDLQTALAERDGPVSRHEFLIWLRARVAERGPAVTLVTDVRAVRRTVDQLARCEHKLVVAVTRDQVST